MKIVRKGKNAVFVISLDLELRWGVLNRNKGYEKNILGVHSAVPSLLELFKKYNIHATWAAVGLLFFKTRDEMLNALPVRRPDYPDKGLCAYHNMANVGPGEKEDPLHFAPSLIKLIGSFPFQEIASHTFSHYLCQEKGQDLETFRADLMAALKAANRCKLDLETIIFPKHQLNSEYLSLCREKGFRAYRGNASPWIYSTNDSKDHNLPVKKLLRLLDAYFNITGHNTHPIVQIGGRAPINIPSSHFLRPYSKVLKCLEPLRLKRICSGLTYAAQRGHIYHLWWHPHNFGANLPENLVFLEKIIGHFLYLKKIYGMESLNMGELSRQLMGDRSGIRTIPSRCNENQKTLGSTEKNRAFKTRG